MRHLGSLALSLVLGPLIWVLTGIGLSRYTEGIASLRTLDGAQVLGMAALLVAGVLTAALLLPRLSPVGPMVIGFGYAVLVAWMMVGRDDFVTALPADLFGARLALQYPAFGTAVPLAVLFLATALIPHRWRRTDRRPAYPGAYGAPAGPYTQPPPAGYPGGALYPPVTPVRPPPIWSPPSAPHPAEVTTRLTPSGPPPPEVTTRLTPAAPPPHRPAPPVGSEVTTVLPPPPTSAEVPSDATVMLSAPPSTYRADDSDRAEEDETDRLGEATQLVEEPTRRIHSDPPDPDATRRI